VVGTSGLGLISSSNFYVPQVNLQGSMASFAMPAGIPLPVPVTAPVVAVAQPGPATAAGFDLSSLVPWLVLG
jgi:hypothetical protein